MREAHRQSMRSCDRRRRRSRSSRLPEYFSFRHLCVSQPSWRNGMRRRSSTAGPSSRSWRLTPAGVAPPCDSGRKLEARNVTRIDGLGGFGDFADQARAVIRSSQPCELPLQQVDLCDIAADVVIAASLAGSELERAARVRVANAASAQVDHGGEVLTLLQRGGGDAVALQRSRDTAIE